jgi:hypothetical protein
MTAGYNHLGKSDACFHPLGAVGEAHVKALLQQVGGGEVNDRMLDGQLNYRRQPGATPADVARHVQGSSEISNRGKAFLLMERIMGTQAGEPG